FQALLDFPLDVCGRGTAEWGEQRQTRVSIYREQRMPLEHFDCRDECGRRHLACGDVARDDGLGLARVLADDARRLLAAETPAAVSRLAARSRRDMSFTPSDPAVAVAYLDNDRFKLGEGAVGQHIGTNKGQPHGSQHNLLQSHRLSSVVFDYAVATPSMDPLITFDLAAMHDPPGLGIERVAPMHHGKIVPHQQIADLPPVA